VVAVSAAVCVWCRCELTEESTGGGSGLCGECLIERLRAAPTEGIPLNVMDALSDMHWYAFLCPRCGGSGHVYASSRTPDTYCFGCGGAGWILRDREGVQRTARWWATYQSNRQPKRSS